jgi:predicted nucleic acid-binding Zn ribbon protein
MRYDVVCESCKAKSEIAKPMGAAMPKCAACGGQLRNRFTSAPPVQYNAAGFYATDVQRFKSQVGARRFAQFEAQRSDIQKRAKAGKLTAYEKALDRPVLNRVSQ